jgi:hypothetical protein
LIGWVSIVIVLFFGWNCARSKKYAHIGSTMTTSIKVQISPLMNIMLTRRREELSVVEENACSYCPMWKLAFHAMAAKMS